MLKKVLMLLVVTLPLAATAQVHTFEKWGVAVLDEGSKPIVLVGTVGSPESMAGLLCFPSLGVCVSAIHIGIDCIKRKTKLPVVIRSSLGMHNTSALCTKPALGLGDFMILDDAEGKMRQVYESNGSFAISIPAPTNKGHKTFRFSTAGSTAAIELERTLEKKLNQKKLHE